MAKKTQRKKRNIAAIIDEMISSEKCLLENEFDTTESIKEAEVPVIPGLSTQANDADDDSLTDQGAIVQGFNLIPASFKGYRLKLVANIVELLTGKCYSTKDLQRKMELLDNKHGEKLKGLGTPSLEQLWQTTVKMKEPYLKFLGPPVMNSCGKQLYEQYGSDDNGYRYYDQSADYLKASRKTYISRSLCELFAAAGHHAWCLFEGNAEIYNEMARLNKSGNAAKTSQYLSLTQDKGCGNLGSCDGNWKLSYPICMFDIQKEISGFSGQLNYVSTCPEQPEHEQAFCKEHINKAQSLNIPTTLKEYKEYKKKPNVTGLGQNVLAAASDCQGTSETILKFPELSTQLDDEDVNAKSSCNKDTGEKRRLQWWTRGHFFIIRGGGHIDNWQPLYQSEGPAQVFLIVLVWLIAAIKHLKRRNWKKFILSYDNMCHLDNLRVAKKELPLPGDQKYLRLDM
uniref:CxC5 like cysteine cluster associated with KDZ domain-containing protein n=1 Tax=Amphimedon queenslandica TaxID=400682 RepID=A0A1X7V1C7_AMPQE